MLEAAEILRAGGIIAPKQSVSTEARPTGVIRARRYGHEALPGRVVVRLSADAIAPGADVEMETLGFGAPAVSEPLGQQRFRALGFPGWALVNDPKHAKFALEVMKDFKRAAARVRSKPGHARDAFVAIADRLARSVPHFLPSFWEEAGRVFLAEENTSYAAQSFEKARQIEQEHKLQIDEAVRAEVFLEFALAGAVTVKSLSAYGKELERAYGSAKAYAQFAELATRRTLGGMPPWTGMPKDLRALSKAAKLDADAEDERLLGVLLEASSVSKAPAEFWNAYRPALLRMAKASPAVRTRLRHLFPTGSGSGFESWWLELIAEAGVVDALCAAPGDGGEPAGSAAAWLGRVLAYAAGDKRLPGLLERLAPRLVADGVPLQVVHGNHWSARADLDVCERALELGVTLAEPPTHPNPAWRRTPFDLTKGFVCDPVRVAAEERFGSLLSTAVAAAMGQAAFEQSSRGKKGVVAARRAWVHAQVEAIGGGMVALEATLPVVRDRTSYATFAEFPEERDALVAAAPHKSLARTLRGGLFDELGWAAAEEAMAELGGAKGLKISGAMPYAVFHNAAKAIVVGAGRVLEHDLHVKAPSEAEAMYFIGGQLFVRFYDRAQGGWRGYWSGAPQDTFPLDAEYLYFTPLSVTLPDGSATFGGRRIAAGDTQGPEMKNLVSDGEGLWVAVGDEGKMRLRELDPATGNLGRFSWPTVVEKSLQPGDEVTLVHLMPLPAGAEASPLGSKDGLVGVWIVRNGDKVFCVSIDGRRAALSGTAEQAALLRMPGDDRPRLAASTSHWDYGRSMATTLFDEHGTALGTVKKGSWYMHSWPFAPPLAFWHFLSPRDPAGSSALRSTTDEQASALLVTARADRARADGDFTATRQKIESTFPSMDDAKLKEGVLGVVTRAAELADELARVTQARLTAPEAGQASDLTPEDQVDTKVLRDALTLFSNHSYAQGDTASELYAAGRWVGGGTGVGFTANSLHWEAWLGRIRGIAVLAASAGLTAEQRAVVLRFLRLWQRTPLAQDLAKTRLATFHVRLPNGMVPGEPHAGTWLAFEKESRYFVRQTQARDGMVTLRVIERARDGQFRLPDGVTLENETRLTGDSDAAWLAGFLEEMNARGAPPWDATAAQELARRTGLTRAEASLLWAGLPRIGSYLSDFLGKELRATLGLKSAEASAAAETFKGLDDDALGLFFAAASEDPRALWTPVGKGPEDESSPVARLAAAWVAKRGKRIEIREDLIVACKQELKIPLPVPAVLGALLDPGSASFMQSSPSSVSKVLSHGQWNQDSPDGFGVAAAVTVDALVRFLFGALPVGDAYRSAVPKLWEVARARLAEPALVLPLGNGWFTEENRAQAVALMEALGGKESSKEGRVVRDAGALVVALEANGGLSAVFRPSLVKDYENEPQLTSVVKALNYGSTAFGAARYLASSDCAALIARIRETPVPAGEWESNPRHASPKTVEAVRKALKLGEDAAVLYLQLLALPRPTGKNVQLWNGWNAAKLKAAGAELLAKKLVVEGKRERAGREIFLPGAWDKAAVLEPWKKAIYREDDTKSGTLLPGAPLHTLFERAWKRIEAGDKPAFEEV
jgi:hypothetical protein